MINKLVVIFAESELTKYEETSEPYEVSSWEDSKVFRTEEEKSEILKKWKEEEHTSSEMVSGRPYWVIAACINATNANDGQKW